VTFCIFLFSQDFVVPSAAILRVWRREKISHDVCIQDMIESRDMSAVRHVEFVEWHRRSSNDRRLADLERAVQADIERGLMPFRVIPAVSAWVAGFSDEGVRLRYSSLCLVGPSRAGKTNFGMSLFSRSRTLVVNCQGLRPHLPCVREFNRQQFSAILWDEIDPVQVLSNKVVFQSGPMRVAFQQSACNAFAYSQWLWGVPHIFCTNAFPMESGARLSDGSLLSEEGADWLQQNVVVVRIPDGETWYEAVPTTHRQLTEVPQPGLLSFVRDAGSASQRSASPT
jgi:hypothetical protein